MVANEIIPYICFRLGLGTLPMVSLMSGEIAVFCLFHQIVVVPVPFGIGTNVFQEIFDRSKKLLANRTGRMSGTDNAEYVTIATPQLMGKI